MSLAAPHPTGTSSREWKDMIPSLHFRIDHSFLSSASAKILGYKDLPHSGVDFLNPSAV